MVCFVFDVLGKVAVLRTPLVLVYSPLKGHCTTSPLGKRLLEVCVWVERFLPNDQGVSMAVAVPDGITLDAQSTGFLTQIVLFFP